MTNIYIYIYIYIYTPYSFGLVLPRSSGMNTDYLKSNFEKNLDVRLSKCTFGIDYIKLRR